MLCLRCGLELVAPPYLERETPPELDTSVLQPVAVSRRGESKLPATLVMCAVLVLAAGIVMSSTNRTGNTVQAIPQDATTTMTVQASSPTEPALKKSLPGVPGRTPLNGNASLPTGTPAPIPQARTATLQPADTTAPPPPAAAIPVRTDTPAPPAPSSTSAAGPARLLPGIGSYVSGLSGWWVKLDGIGSRTVLWSPAPDTRHDTQGTFWLAYIVHRNDSDTPRSLGATLDFAMVGSDGNPYSEYSEDGRDPQRKKIAAAMHANTLDFIVAPGQRTATVLVFDLPSGVEPVRLLARSHTGDTAGPHEQAGWDLRKTP